MMPSPLCSPKLRSLTCAALLLLGLAACGGDYPPPPETEQIAFTETLHGVEFEDPYRWLEDQDSPETRAFIDRQNEYAELIVGEPPERDWARRRLSELIDTPAVGSPNKAGEYELFTLRRTGEELAAIVRRPAPEDADAGPAKIDPAGEYEVVIDPAEVGSEYAHLGIVSVSPDGKLLLYNVRIGGEDETTVRLRDLEQNVDLDFEMPRALNDQAFFAKDGSGIYYTVRDRMEGPRVRFHRFGTERAEDALVFGEGIGPRAFVRAEQLDEEKLLVGVQHGWARSDLYLVEVGTWRATPIVEGMEARFNTHHNDGRLFVRTNLGAPLNRLMEIDLDQPEVANWNEVVPEADDVLQGVSVINGKLYLTYLHHVASRIRVFELDGTPAGEIEVPEHHNASIRGAGEGKALLSLVSYLQPSVTWLLDLETGTREVFREAQLPFDGTGYVLKQVRYTSKDGTSAPMYIAHREDFEPDGTTPALLNGYGGFNVSLTPRFNPLAALWLEAGGVYAVATLRGGSEYGEEWHQAGMLHNKQTVFDDFISAGEWLIAEGYSDPDRLAIHGASNGGLLVGASLTQRPDLYRAVLCGFPELDLIRFYTFSETNNMPALLEYGDGEIPDQFESLRGFSPYQAIRDGVAYPAVMLTQGDLDTRVPPLQARKVAARLQAASSSGLPVIMRYHPYAGHAASRGLPMSERVEFVAAEATFLLTQTGLTAPGGQS
ncbi:MAG: prolyl oligopeptidase family serine peptidase [Acidobacteriota bacterium]|nr:prolyl oligopeptidase family serine peptidase [Acidobacteriota bacterium]